MDPVVHPPGVEVLVVLTHRCVTLQPPRRSQQGRVPRPRDIARFQAQVACSDVASRQQLVESTFLVELYRALHKSLTCPMINKMAQLQEIIIIHTPLSSYQGHFSKNVLLERNAVMFVLNVFVSQYEKKRMYGSALSSGCQSENLAYSERAALHHERAWYKRFTRIYSLYTWPLSPKTQKRVAAGCHAT